MYVSKFISDPNLWLGLVFILYIATIFTFSRIYYSIYRRNPRSFAFNVDILKARSELFKLHTDKEVADLRVQLDALNQLSEILKNRTRPILKSVEDEAIIESITYKYVFKLIALFPDDPIMGGPQLRYVLSIYNAEGQQILSDSNMSPTDVPWLINRTDNLLNEKQRRLGTLSGATPDVWSYWDFLYFSTITQTTVGYGDMLPNSTLIRMLVALQILVGMLFLVVVINLVFQQAATGGL